MLLNSAKGLFFWNNWHPEVAIRYLPVVAQIKKIGISPSVLDVGSGGLGIAPYIGYSVTGVDLRFRPPYHSRLQRIKASAANLPFADSSFDAVISVDTFEHMSLTDREKAIREMVRTARKLVIIAVPCGKESYRQDKELHRFYRKKFKKKYRFFEEQLKLGLPEESEMIKIINQIRKDLNSGFRLQVLDNENLKLREFLMKGWMTKNIFTDIFFRKILLTAIPVFVNINSPPVYRKIFIIRK